MASNDYHFITHWGVKGAVDEVAAVLQDTPDMVRWWPSVYLDIQEIEHGAQHPLNSA